jgi:hypothetical protein
LRLEGGTRVDVADLDDRFEWYPLGFRIAPIFLNAHRVLQHGSM